ncbi:MAG: hypothetical protein ABIT38_15585 [Gemmatimonadaceae bacterium]
MKMLAAARVKMRGVAAAGGASIRPRVVASLLTASLGAALIAGCASAQRTQSQVRRCPRPVAILH